VSASSCIFHDQVALSVGAIEIRSGFTMLFPAPLLEQFVEVY
jgi:hypothetical protein